jgi:hypothetical protein
MAQNALDLGDSNATDLRRLGDRHCGGSGFLDSGIS